jgi:glucose/arabinose dehydrogenase
MTHRHLRTRYLAVPTLFVLALVAFLLAVTAGPQASSASVPVAPPNAPNEDGTEPLPPGAISQTLLSNMEYPVALAFDPSGRLFYTESSTPLQ